MSIETKKIGRLQRCRTHPIAMLSQESFSFEIPEKMRHAPCALHVLINIDRTHAQTKPIEIGGALGVRNAACTELQGVNICYVREISAVSPGRWPCHTAANSCTPAHWTMQSPK